MDKSLTILGPAGGITLQGSGDHRVLRIGNLYEVVLENLIIRGGHTSNSGVAAGLGGGIFNANGPLLISGSTIAYNGPAAEIAAAARDTGARMVALSSVYANPESLASELRALREALPTDVDVVIGGQGVTTLNGAGDIAGVATLPDLAALRKRLARR